MPDGTPEGRLSAGPEADGLLARARSGHQQAWSSIVAEIGPVVRGLAAAKGVPDPDDLTQDVFVAVASRLGSFEGDWQAFRSWIFSIAYRQIVNRWRAKDKETVQLPGYLVEPGALSLEDEVITNAAAGDALAALEVLSDDERDVILLRVLGGLDTAEVSQVVGKRQGNIRVIQTRALKKLRAELIRRGYGELAGTSKATR